MWDGRNRFIPRTGLTKVGRGLSLDSGSLVTIGLAPFTFIYIFGG